MLYSNRFLLFFCFFIFSIAAQAQSIAPQLTLNDVVLIKRNQMGIKTFQHEVRAGQSPATLKSYYQLSDEEWDFFNPDWRGQALVPSQSVTVPIPNRAIIRYDTSSVYDKRYCIPIYHIVKQGETFFGLYNRWYAIDAGVLKKRNKLTSTSLKTGQQIHVGWFDIRGVPEAEEGSVSLSPQMKAMLPYRTCYFERLDYRDEFEHKGMAVRSDVDNMRYGYKVLHAHAKIGSCIRITNPARNATVYAEVVGRIPSSITQQYFGRPILAVYTPTVGRALGLVDKQFYANIRFTK